MTEFKVGQRVRSVTPDCLEIPMGTEKTIVEVDEYGSLTFESSSVRRVAADWCRSPEKHFEIIEGANMYEKGKILVDADGKREFMVLAVLDDLVATSKIDEFDEFDEWYTFKQMEDWQKKGTWVLKEEPETTELSIDDIAKKFKLKPEQVRIKKQD